MEWPSSVELIALFAISTIVIGVLMSVSALTRNGIQGKTIGIQLLVIILIQSLIVTSNAIGLTIAQQGTLALLFLLGPVSYIQAKGFFSSKPGGYVKHVITFILIVNVMAYQLLTYDLIYYVALFHLIGYFILTSNFVRKEALARGIRFFDNPGSRLSWFRNYLGFQCIVYTYLGYLLLSSPYFLGVGLSVLFGIWILFPFFQVLTESVFFTDIPLGQKYAKSSLTADQKYSILNRLQDFMEAEKYYLSSNASLSDLAVRLNTSTHNLSQVLNEHKHSFFDMISAYRIRAACKILKDPAQPQLKVEEVANQVGYNSKSAFNTAFKRHTGMTPSLYKASKDVLPDGDVQLANRKIPNSSGSHRTFGQVKINTAMIRNYYKIFMRTLMRNKIFSTINLFGLTLGFICCMLMYLFINDELSYDTSIPNYDHIYRVYWQTEQPQTRTPHPFAQAIKEAFPEVVSAVSISPWYGPGLSRQNVAIRNIEKNIYFDEPDFYFVDTTFFDVFAYELIQGDKATALKTIGGIIITESIAKKYFGNENPIGKSLAVGEDRRGLGITGVIQDPPENAHFHFNFLFSYASLKAFNPDDHWMTWADFGHFNYLKLKKNSNANILEDKIPEWAIKYYQGPAHAIQRFEDRDVQFRLQPIADIHLKSNLKWELEANGNILYIYILGGTIIFILLIVSINYINLTTAKSLERAKEIGIKKTLGAIKGQLSLQFLMESITYAVLAMMVATLLTLVLLPEFNQLTSKNFRVNEILNFPFLLQAFGLAILLGLVSGIYPARILSSFNPTDVLKGRFSSSSIGLKLRRILIVVQFVVSAALICSSLIIFKQIDFLQNKELGFEDDFVISIPIRNSDLIRKFDVIKKEIKAIDGTINVSAISNLPGGQFNQNPAYVDTNPTLMVDMSEWRVDFDALDVLGIALKEGRNFDPTHTLDSAGKTFIVNEMALQHLAIEDPIGTKIVWQDNEITREGHIIGVVRDFHFKSLHTAIRPMIMQILPEDFNEIIIKMRGQNMTATLDAIQQVYTQFEKEHTFEYTFLDEQMLTLYTAEVKTLRVFGVFALVALFLACLGLLGMAITILNQRIKEVGIRKILGASTGQIIRMIMRSFSILIMIALVIGLPLAYVSMQAWINEFPYQTSIGLSPFILSSLILLTVALSSVSIVIIRIAFSNPAAALRYE